MRRAAGLQLLSRAGGPAVFAHFGRASRFRDTQPALQSGLVKPTWLACCLAAASSLACSGVADIPDTPDLRQLLQSYEAPTASIDGTRAVAALNSTPYLEELAAGIRAASYVMGDVDYASETSSRSTGERIRLQGSIGLALRCPGDPTQPNDESDNGSISLSLAVAENRIRRSFWGAAKSCVLQGTVRGVSARIVLDGPMAFDVGRDIGLGQGWSGELLASLPGTLQVEGFEFRSITGRLTEGRFQYLVTLEDAETIVLELGDGGITVRDKGGAWFCGSGESCAAQ